MPAIYLSFEVEPGDTVAQKQTKLYLGMMSCGEQAYTLGAALGECRKKQADLDDLCRRLKADYFTLKDEVRCTTQTGTALSQADGYFDTEGVLHGR
jgi:hypothetical protein